jgi:hypothetical protein
VYFLSASVSLSEFVIINNDPATSKSYSNFTIAFRIGIGVNIAWANGVMEMLATITPAFMVSSFDTRLIATVLKAS